MEPILLEAGAGGLSALAASVAGVTFKRVPTDENSISDALAELGMDATRLAYLRDMGIEPRRVARGSRKLLESLKAKRIDPALLGMDAACLAAGVSGLAALAASGYSGDSGYLYKKRHVIQNLSDRTKRQLQRVGLDR